MTERKRDDAREHPRAPVTLQIEYRTIGSFLLSYSLNLSNGGLFLETTASLPAGTHLRVRFSVPVPGQTWPAGYQVETDATVVWARESPTPDGQPSGIGLSFDPLDEQIGKLIDTLVRDFSGVTLMAVAGNTAAVERLARQLCTVLSCSVRRCTSVREALSKLLPDVDLVVLDLDSVDKEGLVLVEQAQQRRPRIPLLALARETLLHLAAADAGVTVLENPPALRDLRAHVLELLGKPAAA